MPRCRSLSPYLPVTEVESRSRTCRDHVERSHWHIVWLVSQGQTCPAVARLTGSSETWVRTLVHRSNADGPAGLGDHRHANPGQPPAVQAEVRRALAEPPPDGGLWTSPQPSAWLSARLGRPVSPQRAWETLPRIGFSQQPPRPRARAADPVAQAAVKKGGSGTRSTPSGEPTRTRR